MIGTVTRREEMKAGIKKQSIEIECSLGQYLLSQIITEEVGHPQKVGMRASQSTDGTPGQYLQKASGVPITG
jgi:hypothetical protein